MRRKFTSKSEGYFCIGLLALLPVLAMAPSIIHGTLPIDAAGLLSCPPWQEAQPTGLLPETPAVSADLRFYAWYAFLHDAAQSGKSILWNPLEGFGTPFLAVWQTRCLSPFSLPFYFFPVPIALRLSILLKLITAGWCAYHAARRFGYTAPLALAAGVAFQFSGGVFLWANWPISDVLPWFPLLFVLTERIALSQTHYWPLASLIIAAMGLGGDPGALVAALAFAVTYLAIRMLSMRTPALSMLINTWSSFAAAFFGLALIAVQLLPYYEFTQQGSLAPCIPSTGLHLKDFILCFLPNFLDNAPLRITDGEVARDFHAIRLFHVGIIQAISAIFWLSYSWLAPDAKRGRINALFLTSILMTLVAIFASGGPNGMFGLSLLSSGHFLACNAIIAALIAVAASDQWLALRRYDVPGALWRLVFIVPPLLVVALGCLLAWHGEARPGAPSFWFQLSVALVFSLALFVLAGWTLYRPSTRLMGYGLALLTFVSLLYAADHIPSTKANLVFPETEFIKDLKENAGPPAAGGRIAGGPELSQWPLAGNLIPQVYNPCGITLDRTAPFLERLKNNPGLTEDTGTTNLLLTKQDIQGPFASMRSILSIRQVFSTGAVLFSNPKAKPRARVVYTAGNSAPPASPTPVPPEAKVTVTDPLNTRAQVEVEGPQPGTLVLCDAYYPGWKATVDGEDTPVLPLENNGFRGVAIKEGRHHVEFYYAPTFLKTGLLITLAAALIILFELRHIPVHYRE